MRLSALNGLAAPGGRRKGPFAATDATSRNVPAVTGSVISDKISSDFVREGTGKLIFHRQYSRELVERVCTERGSIKRGWVMGTLGKALSFLGWESISASTLQFTSNDDVVLQAYTYLKDFVHQLHR